ncbi:uncharacterized protein [Epargyreus clarus]|uniref:uncharacterized protein n=1 Tax=Epargyreus clarus TaxID=520877 RepID=UPI003C2BEA3A
MSDTQPISEAGSPPPLPPSSCAANNVMMEQMSLFSSGMEAIFQRIAENMTSHHTVESGPIRLVNFDPDEPEADIVNWCTLSELIIKKKKMDGVDLIIALTHSLKGRAAMCLTKIQPDKLSWDAIKETLISRFSKPMVMQDYFDEIIKFQIDNKESPAEAGMRLWQLIEKIPGANIPEKVATGFAISVLSQCDDKIRRELNSVVINSKTQLFRTLRGFTLKRKNDDLIMSDSDPKRSRTAIPFRGTCNFCGRIGHRGFECRDQQRQSPSKIPTVTTRSESPHTWAGAPSARPRTNCYVCGDASHIATACPMRYKKKENVGCNGGA